MERLTCGSDSCTHGRMAAPNASPWMDLSGSISIHLPVFKRKRIEQWCEEVAHYLRAGSLCKSVIGHSPEDGGSLPGPVVNSTAAGGSSLHHRTTFHISAIPATSNTAGVTCINTSMGNMSEMLAYNNVKNNSGGLASSGGGGEMNGCSATPPEQGTPMPDTSSSLPVVKLSNSYYYEQRRRVDRLVQGLPVLSSSATSPSPGGDRLGTDAGNGRMVFVSGEESAITAKSRTDRTTGRTSSAPAPAQPVRSKSRSSSGEPQQQSFHPQLSRHHSVSPTQNRSHHHHHNIKNINNNGINNKPGTLKGTLVIEDDLHRDQDRQGFVGNGLSSVRLNMQKRAQSLKVQRARQHILAGTHRSVEHSTCTHVPVQSCWTLAELTW